MSAPTITDRQPASADLRIANHPAPNAEKRRYPIAPIAATPNQFGTARNAARSATAAATTASQKRSGLADDRERVVRSVQWFGAAVVSEERDVLDADAEPTRDVDAGLDRERHSGLQLLVIAADEIWVLMAVEADAVSRAVDEPLAVASLVDHAPRRGIDRCRGRATARGRIAGFLRSLHDVVDLTDLVVDVIPDVDRSRDVGAIPRTRAAEVQHDRIAARDAPLAGLVMWRRPVRTGGDDREGHLVVSLFAQQSRQIGADLALGPTSELALEKVWVGAVGCRGDRPQRVALVGVFAHAQTARDVRRELEAATAKSRLQP